jgi:hypothetical protein
MGEDIMHHLINNGSMTNDAYTQEQGETVAEEEEEVEEEEGEEEEEAPVVATASATTVKGEKKAGSRGTKWRSLEDECLGEAWKTVSIDPISGANQNSDTNWARVKVAFDERKLLNPDFNKVHMDHNESGMSNC